MILKFPETGKARTAYIRTIGYRARCANLPTGSCRNLAQNIVEFVDGIGRPVGFEDGIGRQISASYAAPTPGRRQSMQNHAG
jgi:hypothetical protein